MQVVSFTKQKGNRRKQTDKDKEQNEIIFYVSINGVTPDEYFHIDLGQSILQKGDGETHPKLCDKEEKIIGTGTREVDSFTDLQQIIRIGTYNATVQTLVAIQAGLRLMETIYRQI